MISLQSFLLRSDSQDGQAQAARTADHAGFHCPEPTDGRKGMEDGRLNALLPSGTADGALSYAEYFRRDNVVRRDEAFYLQQAVASGSFQYEPTPEAGG